MRILLLPILILLTSLQETAAAVPSAEAKAAWFQVQTRNFTIFSSGRLEDVRRLANRLEQFRQAYSSLAGSQAVSSVPVLVYAFPNGQAFRPFQPLYQGSPKSVAGFFQRDYDENVIALNLETMESGDMDVVFHEYTHLLMRNNGAIWPLWLEEGMAEVYSTFSIANNQVCLGLPKREHVAYLQRQPLMPLTNFFNVNHKSPQYNEKEQSGIFYAQSWLLTHYLMLGDNPTRKAQFSAFTKRLKDEVPADQAFNEIFKTDGGVLEEELKRYLARGRFEPMCYAATGALAVDASIVQRRLPEVEALYQLGNLLLHCHRLDEAEGYFRRAQQAVPESARHFEGFGFVAVRRKNHPAAITQFEQAISRRSVNFRVYFDYARALHGSIANRGSNNQPPPEIVTKMRNSLQRCIQLMPTFGPAHYLLGVLEISNGKDLTQAAQHLQKATQFEPENRNYLLAIAELQMRQKEFSAARRTLSELLRPGIDPEIRRSAEAAKKNLEDYMKRAKAAGK